VIAAAAALSVAKSAASAVKAAPAPRLKRSVHSRSSTAGPTSALTVKAAPLQKPQYQAKRNRYGQQATKL